MVVAIILVLSILLPLATNRKDPAQQDVISLVIAENELLRIADDNKDKFSSADTKRHNSELMAVMQSQSTQLMGELKRVYRIKSISSGQQKAAIDKKSDELLVTAAKLNRLDQDFSQIVSDKLAKQVELAQAAQSKAKNQQLKTNLTKIANDANELRNRFNKGQGTSSDTTP